MGKMLLLVSLFSLAFTACAKQKTPPSAPASTPDHKAEAAESLVVVGWFTSRGNHQTPGVLVAKNIVVTSFNSGNLPVKCVVVTNDGARHEAMVIRSYDEYYDLKFVKINGNGFKTWVPTAGYNPEPGQEFFAHLPRVYSTNDVSIFTNKSIVKRVFEDRDSYYKDLFLLGPSDTNDEAGGYILLDKFGGLAGISVMTYDDDRDQSKNYDLCLPGKLIHHLLISCMDCGY